MQNFLIELVQNNFTNKFIYILIVSHVNTTVMAFTEHGDYSRIFRVTYTEPTATDDKQPTPVTLLTKMFLPCKKNDTIHDIKLRISDWVNQYLCESY